MNSISLYFIQFHLAFLASVPCLSVPVGNIRFRSVPLAIMNLTDLSGRPSARINPTMPAEGDDPLSAAVRSKRVRPSGVKSQNVAIASD